MIRAAVDNLGDRLNPSYNSTKHFFWVGFKELTVKWGKLVIECKKLKNNKHYVALGGQQAQQTIKSVVEAITSYNKLIRCW